MATYKYYRPAGGFNSQKLSVELLAKLGQVVSVTVNDNGSMAIVTAPDGFSQATVDQAVNAHVADANFAMIANGGVYQNAEAQISAPIGVNPNTITLEGLGTLIRMNATVNEVTAGGDIGVGIPDGDTAPAMFLAGTTQESEELIVNGSFEDGLNNWTAGDGVVSAAQAHTGENSCSHSGTSNNTTQTRDIVGGATYTYSFWYMESGAVARQAVSFTWKDGAGGTGSTVRTDIISVGADASFAQYTANLRAPLNALSVIVALIWSGAGTKYIDDVSLKAAAQTSYMYFRPAPTIFAGGLDFQELATAPLAPLSGFITPYGGSNNGLRQLDDFGQDLMLLTGEPGAAVSYVSNNSINTILSKTIKANAAGTKGFFAIDVVLSHLSQDATVANRNITIVVNIGSKAITKTLTGNNNANISPILLHLECYIDQAANAQRYVGRVRHTANPTAGTWTATTTDQMVEDSSTVDFTADVLVTVTVQLGTSSATVAFTGAARMTGPFYGA